MKVKTGNIIDMALQYKISQNKLAKELGFDYSSECFIKGEKRIVILVDIGGLRESADDPKKEDENF